MGHHHQCEGGDAARDPEDPTPRLGRRAACGVLFGGFAAAAGALSPLGPVLAGPVRRDEASLDRRADLRAQTGPLDDGRRPHVVVIGVDGLRPDALALAATPNIDRIIESGPHSFRAFSGGNPVLNEQVTSSGPGWSSICTGVWSDKHGVESNGFITPNYRDYPHFFQRILELEPEAELASYVHWEPVNDIIVDGMSSEFSGRVRMGRAWTIARDMPSYQQRDREVGLIAAQQIRDGDPLVTFLHLDSPDNAGHTTAFAPDSAPYITAIEAVDGALGPVFEAIESRPGRTEERWAFVLTTDHGGINNGHGGQTVEERKIPFLVGGDGLESSDDIHGPGHLAVPATTLAYLGLAVDPDWGWEGDAFGVTASA